MEIDEVEDSDDETWEPGKKKWVSPISRTSPTAPPPSKRPKHTETPPPTLASNKPLRSTTKRFQQIAIDDSSSDESSSGENPLYDAAERAGFLPFEMEPFEQSYFPEYLDYETDYVSTRNKILALWKANQSSFLPWETVLSELNV